MDWYISVFCLIEVLIFTGVHFAETHLNQTSGSKVTAIETFSKKKNRKQKKCIPFSGASLCANRGTVYQQEGYSLFIEHLSLPLRILYNLFS